MEKVATLAIPIYFISIFLEIFFARKFKKDFYNFKDSLGNLGTGVLMQMREMLTKAGILALYIWVLEKVSLPELLGLSLWAEDFSTPRGIFSWVAAFLITDFIYYLFHRHSHEVNLLWAGHTVHHSSEEYNLSVALRQSAIQGLFFTVYLLPLALMGLPAKLVFGCYGLNLIYQFFIHTRFFRSLGFLELFMNTPSHHRVHHARQGKYLDCNYAGVFIIWDKMLGTFIKEEEEPKYGVYPRFQSYDPVRANLYPLTDLMKYFFKASGSDKFKVIFKGPLWLYEHFKKGQKLNILATNSKIDLLVVFYFLSGLSLALLGLFNKDLTFTLKIFIALGVTLLLGLMGRRLDRSVGENSLS